MSSANHLKKYLSRIEEHYCDEELYKCVYV